MSSRRYVAAVADREPAPGELLDDDEWSDVSAMGDYVGQRAEGLEMLDVDVRGGRWSGVVLERWRARDVVFEDCDLSGFVLQDEPTLRAVLFRRCRLSGAVLAGAHLRKVRFEECTLDDVSLRMMDAKEIAFVDSALVGADFYGATIEQATIAACDLRGADFTEARLKDVDFRTSRLEDIVGATALSGVTIGADQVLPLARSLAVALGIKIVEEDPY
jgi:uncharacterized protein YjbI with pentapeptide repeats